MTAFTWTQFLTVLGIAAIFFFTGRLWEHDYQMNRQERLAARRRAARLAKERTDDRR